MALKAHLQARTDTPLPWGVVVTGDNFDYLVCNHDPQDSGVRADDIIVRFEATDVRNHDMMVRVIEAAEHGGPQAGLAKLLEEQQQIADFRANR
jgi:hypothetical protein